MPNFILQSLFAPKKRLLTLIAFCFCISISGNAQNLISNGGFESTGGYTSNYSLITAPFSGNSIPGQYAVTTNPQPVNTANFMTSTDHSGSGNMMIVDGQNNDIFYKYVNLPIQRGLNYTFTYWVKNINNFTNGANPAPKIDLTLSNQCPCVKTLIAGNSDVGAMPAGWNKVSYTINVAGTGTAFIHFELSTNGAGGGGNDFAIDDVSLYAPPAPLTISSSNINPNCPTSTDGTIVAYPNGGVAPFSFTLSGTSSATNSTGIFQNLAGGNYTVSVTDSNSPASMIATGTITLAAPPDITLVESPIGCHLSGDAVILTAANGNGTYNWTASPGGVLAGTGNSKTVNPTVTTTYTVSSSIVPPSVGNLIGNPGFENGTSGFYSDYGYSLTNTSGAQFAYGIVTNPSLWYNKFTTCTDKTSGSGNMLVADGATTADSVIWSQTVPVENSKTYNFSFWVQNIGDGVKATFQVLVNGSPITISPISAANNVTAGTPATTTCNWTNITGTWASGGASLATIKIIDTNISGGGNDFAIDDLSFSTTSSKVCNLTKSLTVNIGGTPPVTTFTYPTPVCKNGTNPTPTGATGFVTGGTYSSTSGLSINGSTGVINLATSTAGTYTVTYAVIANASTCQLAGSSTFDITINSQPTAGTDGNTTVCDNSVAVINLYSLIIGEQTGGTWSRTSGTGGAFNGVAGTFTPAIGATTSTFTYTLTGAAPCVDDSSIATVNINAATLLSINCGTPTATSVTFNWNTIADATSYSYSYSVASATPVTGSVSSATTTLTINSLSPGQNVAITITPVGSACGVAASGNCVSSNCPTPTVDPIANIPVCVNQTVTVPSFTSTPVGAIFNWASNNTSIGIAANGTGDISSFTAVNTTTAVQKATITVTANNGICTGPATTFDIIVNPLPIVTVNSPTVCSGASATVTATPGTVGTYNYAWTVPSGATNPGNVASFTTTVAGNYSVIISNTTTTCVSASASGTVTINSLPTVTVNSPTVCFGMNATVTATPGIAGAYNYVWTVPSGATNPGNAASFTTTVAGNYSVIITNTATTCASASSSGTVTINSLPTVAVNSPTVCSGSSATVTATPGTAGMYDYVWAVPSGATAPGNVASFTTTVAGNYSVVITNTATTCSSASASGSVTINPLPIVTLNSPTVCSGASATVTATPGTVGTYNYAWTVPSGATNPGNVASFTTTVAGNYSVIISNTTTTCVSASASGTVTINSLPTVTVNSPTVCFGMNATVTATPGIAGAYNYVWTVPSGATNPGNAASFTTTVAGNYSVIITNTATTCASASSSGTVTINSLPTVAVNSPTVCSGSSATVTATPGTPGAYNYVWTVPSGVVNPGNVASFTTVVAGNYSVAITNTTTTCSSVGASGIVTINTTPIATATPASQTICSGAQTGIALSSNTTNTTFNWIVLSQVGVTGALSGSGNNISQVLTATGTTLGTVIYSITPTASGCIGNSIQVSIDVTPAPKTIATPSSQSICSGDTTSFVLSSDLIGTTYDWNVVQTNVTGGAAGSGTAISDVLTTIGNNAGQAVYTITPKLNGCYGSPISVVIDVNPIPVVSANPAAETLCSGETTNIALSTSNVVGATFTWTVSQTGVAGASSGSGNMINQILTATGPVQGTVDYTITPLKNGCAGVPIIVTVTVNPTPEVFGPASTTICSGESPNISLSPSIVGTTFDWTVIQSGVTGATDGSGDVINQILETSGAAQGSVIYRVTPTLNGCVGTSLDIKVLVNPLPLPELTDGVICVDQATNVAFQTHTLNTGLSISSYNFEWYFENVLIAGAVSNTYEATLAGNYEVIATNKVTGCVSSPVSANVTASFPGESIATTQTPAFADDATITVTVTGGNGIYEYRLDDGPFQASNIFTNVTAGPHTVTVGDTNGCTNLTQDVFIIGYPKFFTPNGDGFNDSWNLIGLSNQPQAKIYIFDRYGKLLKQISSAGDGWDGTYTGQLMPATDYWFTVEYTELSATKIFRAHFSLLR